MKLFIARLRCLTGRHGFECSVTLYVNANLEHHAHSCPNCDTILWQEITTLSPTLRAMADILGAPLEDQRAYMH